MLLFPLPNASKRPPSLDAACAELEQVLTRISKNPGKPVAVITQFVRSGRPVQKTLFPNRRERALFAVFDGDS